MIYLESVFTSYFWNNLYQTDISGYYNTSFFPKGTQGVSAKTFGLIPMAVFVRYVEEWLTLKPLAVSEMISASLRPSILSVTASASRDNASIRSDTPSCG